MIILPQKIYEILKFVVKFVPLLVAFLGTVLNVCGVGDATISIILTILGAVGTLVEGLIEICKANAWKLKTEEGSIIDIKAAQDEELVGQEG